MSEWVSVEDRLPEVGEHVLVYMKRRGFEPNNICSCEYTDYGFERSSVTHWMPLPEPPK